MVPSIEEAETFAPIEPSDAIIGLEPTGDMARSEGFIWLRRTGYRRLASPPGSGESVGRGVSSPRMKGNMTDLNAVHEGTTAEMERAIARVPGIQAVRVVTAGDRVAEVHVLASRTRGAKQLVRDVQSVALTNFGVEIDYRTVSVVQLEDETPAAAAPPLPHEEIHADEPDSLVIHRIPRPALARIAAETTGYNTEVRVSLRGEGGEHEGAAHGPATSGLRLVAQAVLDAVAERLHVSAYEIAFAELVGAGERQVALVVVRLHTGRGDHVVTGSAPLRKDPNDAIAKAALDAVNRLFSG